MPDNQLDIHETELPQTDPAVASPLPTQSEEHASSQT